MHIQLKNNTFHLLPQKAIFWQEQHCLLLSDLHIGKITHFRKEGIAIPAMGLHDNFHRLDFLLSQQPIRRILFVGDLFHSEQNQEWDMFCAWRNQYSHIHMDIVLGNHDRFSPSIYQEACLRIHEESYVCNGLTFSHEPRNARNEEEYIISGHVHPVIRLSGIANQRFRFPCFYFGQHQAILPSFGYFTGGYAIAPSPTDRVVAIVNEHLIEI